MKRLIYITIFLLSISLVLAEDFSINADKTTGNVPLTVQFSANPIDKIQSYFWDLDGDENIDSTQANPTFTYTKSGNYTVKLDVNSTSGEIKQLTQNIIVKSLITLSIAADPQSGGAPLKVKFTASATGQGLTYSWDFNNDGSIESTQQNPETTYTKDGTYTAKLSVSDSTGDVVEKTIKITVSTTESDLKLVSYFPENVALGDNDLTFIVENDGTDTLSNLEGRIVGNGITTLESSQIQSLKPNDQDSITIKVKIIQQGLLDANVKISDKSFPFSLLVGYQGKINSTQIQANITSLKSLAQTYETEYQKKKVDGYIVDTAGDSLKSARDYLEKAQENLLENKMENAKINLDLATSSLEDVRASLDSAQKQNKTILAWLKDNALAITAIIAAIGGLGGILTKVFGHAKHLHHKVTATITEYRESNKEEEKPKKENKAKKSKKEVKEEKNDVPDISDQQ